MVGQKVSVHRILASCMACASDVAPKQMRQKQIEMQLLSGKAEMSHCC